MLNPRFLPDNVNFVNYKFMGSFDVKISACLVNKFEFLIINLSNFGDIVKAQLERNDERLVGCVAKSKPPPALSLLCTKNPSRLHDSHQLFAQSIYRN